MKYSCKAVNIPFANRNLTKIQKTAKVLMKRSWELETTGISKTRLCVGLFEQYRETKSKVEKVGFHKICNMYGDNCYPTSQNFINVYNPYSRH